MKIGLIDADWSSRGKCTFPNLALMKISAHHKAQGDSVEWWAGFTHYDHVYISRVFDSTYTQYQEPVIYADTITYGGPESIGVPGP